LKTGRVDGKTTRCHTSTDFVGFLADLVAKTRWAKEIHIVLAKIRKYIQAYAKAAKPFRWTYTDPKRRIQVTK
jgi:hypothetical protein